MNANPFPDRQLPDATPGVNPLTGARPTRAWACHTPLACHVRGIGPRARRRPAGQRRGVILLVVLALLSLFVVISLTYVLIASQFRRTARATSAATLRGQDPSRLLDDAAYQVFVGTRNSRSALGPHSLLEDLYGRDGFPGMVGGNRTACTVNGVQVYPVNPVTPTNSNDPDDPIHNPQAVGGELVIFDFSYDMGPDLRPGIANVDDDDDGQTDNLTEAGWRGSDDNLFGSDRSYDPGPDLQPGAAGVDDDGNGTTDDSLELGWPGTDDRENGLSGAPGIAGRDDDDDDADGIDNNAGVIDYDPTTGQPDLGEWGAANSDDHRLSPINGYYTGQLLTFLSGPAAGQSVRITGYEIQASYRVANQTDPAPLDDVLDPRDASTLNPVLPLGTTAPRFAVGRLRVVAPSGVSDLNELIGSRFWINGRPLNGTGFGASPQSVTAFRDQAQTTNILLGATHWPLAIPGLPLTQPWERALLPNAALFDRSPGAWLPPGSGRDVYTDPAGFGGADEDYDAVDYQNMLLAMRRTILDGTAATESLAPVVEMPSLHRPDLILYWYYRIAAEIQSNPNAFGLGAAPTNADAARMVLAPTNSALPPVGQLLVTSLKRRISLRPLAEDHPNFTGSNAAFAQYAQDLGNTSPGPVLPGLTDPFRIAWEVNGLGLPVNGAVVTPTTPPQWDVDNDGDGVGDSVWVDLGFPVQTSADGRRYKPLAAILCIDLDSKLNLNTHGSPVHLPGKGLVDDLNDDGQVEFNGSFAGEQLPELDEMQLGSPIPPGFFGQGYGPADINLRALMRGDVDRDGDLDAVDEKHNQLELYNLFRGNPIGNEGALAGLVAPNWWGVPTVSPAWWGSNANPPREGADGRYGERVVYSLDPSRVPNPGRSTLRPDFDPEHLEEPLQQLTSLDSGLFFDPSLGGPRGFSDGAPYDYRGDLLGAIGPPPPAPPDPDLQRLRFLGPYGSPNDVDGDGLLALDLRGQPMYLAAYRPGGSVLNTSGFGELLGERYDDPYEVNLFAAARTGYYTANVLGNPVSTTRDNPFRPDELEALLRAFDPDAGSAANRLATLAPVLAANARLRALVTTESWDLPVPSLAVTFDWVRENGLVASDGVWPRVTYQPGGVPLQAQGSLSPLAQPGRTTLLDLFRAALLRNDPGNFELIARADPQGPFDPSGRVGEFASGDPALRDRDRVQLNLALSSSGYDPNTGRIFTGLLSGELLAGLKFDLNRPLGNGRDADTDSSDPIEVRPNAVVDDERETGVRGKGGMLSHETVWNNLDNPPAVDLPSGTDFPDNGFNSDLNGDGRLDAQDYLSRYEYVKTLYVLLHLLADQGLTPFVFDFVEHDPGSLNTHDPHEKARLFAQWAVNVVDFRDRDSIMTGFEYDVEPFRDNNGDGLPWDVDGFIGLTPGADGAWGIRGDDDNGNQFFDEWEEAGAGGDDVVSPDDNTPANEQVTNAYRRVVWGCERPELLITETLAFHDRRSTDESTGGGTIAGGDTDFDQKYRPKGSVIIELFNPGPRYDAKYTDGTFVAPPAELYDDQLRGIELHKKTPFGNWPVWRLAIQEGALTPQNPPASPEVPAPLEPRITIDGNWRTVYFTQPPSDDGSGVGYFCSINPDVLRPGRYAVIAPKDSYYGGDDDNRTVRLGRTIAVNGGQYPRTLILTPDITQDFIEDLNQLVLRDGSGNERYPQEDNPMSMSNQSIQPPLGILVDRAFTTDPIMPVSDARFSISEPQIGYPAPDVAPVAPMDGTYTTIDDEPKDSSLTGTSPIRQYNNGTFFQYSVVYLQRLANPLRAYDEEENPYLTVDQMPLDLTIYNGESTTDDPGLAGKTSPVLGAINNVRFDTRQRDGGVARHLLRQRTRVPDLTTSIGGAIIGGREDNSAPPLVMSSLGYLNLSLPHYGSTDPIVNQAPANTAPLPAAFTMGWRYHRNSTDGDKLPTVPNGAVEPNHDQFFVGDPDTTSGGGFGGTGVFPWLNWNNRPFISAYELLQVPLASPSQLLAVPVDRQAGSTNGGWGWNIRQNLGDFAIKNVPAGTPVDKVTEISFGHLAPFFMKDGTALRGTPPVGGNPNPQTKLPTPGPGFSRLIELVHVPTRFNGADRWLNPGTFEVSYVWSPDPATATNGMDPWEYDEPYQQFDVPTAGMTVPHNKVSEYREPGRINLNTVFDPIVWRAMTHDLGGANDTDFWNQIWKSRRGYGFGLGNVGPGNPLSSPYGFGVSADFNANSPSYFANPFRGAGGHFLVPLERMRFNELDNSVNGNVRTDLDVGWLRPLPVTVGGGDVQPLFSQTFAEPWRNTTQNPAFRYQFLNKLGNTVTNRSNVYAVWVTIGFFEVEAVDPEQYQWSSSMSPIAAWGLREFFRAFPDGFRLGRELGTDTGNVRRHRAFYLFDRSLPVAFERGQRHNVENAILLRRTLE